MSKIVVTDRLIREFWARVTPKGKRECWNWRGQVSARGYGRQQNPPGNHALFAHRVSFAIHFGDTALYVCHRCDNPRCVNPYHLFAGTQLDNMRDMLSKGRKSGPLGVANHKAKLTAAKVRYIRQSRQSHSALGRKFGVSHQSIRSVRLGENWGWLV